MGFAFVVHFLSYIIGWYTSAMSPPCGSIVLECSVIRYYVCTVCMHRSLSLPNQVELGPMGPKTATKFGSLGPNLGGSESGMTVLCFMNGSPLVVWGICNAFVHITSNVMYILTLCMYSLCTYVYYACMHVYCCMSPHVYVYVRT